MAPEVLAPAGALLVELVAGFVLLLVLLPLLPQATVASATAARLAVS
jgi:hypothetical protein